MERKWVPLPPYRSLLVVDVKDFSGLPGRDHAAVTDAIPDILYGAFERVGAVDEWARRRFAQSTGDGLSAAFDSAVLPLLVDPLPRALQEELEFRAQVDGLPGLRMRMSVAVGPITDPNPDGVSTGSGHARVENHRLLDADVVKDLLARSGPATRVAAAISSRAFEDAVVSGYAGVGEDRYVGVPVRVKSFDGTVYLRVPLPTGDLLRSGFEPSAAVDAPAPAPADRDTWSNHVSGVVHGDVVQSRDHHYGDRSTYTAHGDNNVNSGSGTQFTGDGVRYYGRQRP
ncbi:hypothetical protein [Saccharothrix xinjiangensis]|uniref:Class 3 adenylate cyclase n=1 Tax=Saccharothrix xinjiangensis TaxID=204798 RepID=A0ABV9XYZ3_9PSEU